MLCGLIGRLRDARARHANTLTVLPISPERGDHAPSQTAVGSRSTGGCLGNGAGAGPRIGSPDGGMDVSEVLPQDRFGRPAANPIVFAAPLLCDAW